jgi:FMN phosphatase YigB (HAD superfamily)
MDETLVGTEELRAILFDLGGVVIDIDFKRAFQVWAARASCDAADLEQRFALEAQRVDIRGGSRRWLE